MILGRKIVFILAHFMLKCYIQTEVVEDMTGMHAKLLQVCPTLCDPRDCSPPGSSVHGILQARLLEWVAMPSLRGSSQPRDQTHISCVSCIGRRFFVCLPLMSPGKP